MKSATTEVIPALRSRRKSSNLRRYVAFQSYLELSPFQGDLSDQVETNSPNSIQVSGAAIIDTQVSYDIEQFTVLLSVVNLLNRDVFETYQYFSFPVVMPIQPRSAYVSFVTKF